MLAMLSGKIASIVNLSGMDAPKPLHGSMEVKWFLAATKQSDRPIRRMLVGFGLPCSQSAALHDPSASLRGTQYNNWIGKWECSPRSAGRTAKFLQWNTVKNIVKIAGAEQATKPPTSKAKNPADNEKRQEEQLKLEDRVLVQQEELGNPKRMDTKPFFVPNQIPKSFNVTRVVHNVPCCCVRPSLSADQRGN